MSKERKNGSARAFFSRNGFYIALVVCVIAAAIASYSAVSNILGNLRDDSAVVQQPPAPAPTPDPRSVIDSSGDPETPEPIDKNAEPDPDVSAINEQLVPIYSRALDGGVMKPFSGDELVYNATLKDWRTHNGTDYQAPEGTEVRAVYSGEILRTGHDKLLGNFVEQKLDSGYTVLYANLAPVTDVKAGDRISQGDLLGRVASSAILENGELPHLHLEVRSGDKYIDP